MESTMSSVLSNDNLPPNEDTTIRHEQSSLMVDLNVVKSIPPLMNDLNEEINSPFDSTSRDPQRSQSEENKKWLKFYRFIKKHTVHLEKRWTDCYLCYDKAISKCRERMKQLKWYLEFLDFEHERNLEQIPTVNEVIAVDDDDDTLVCKSTELKDLSVRPKEYIRPKNDNNKPFNPNTKTIYQTCVRFKRDIHTLIDKIPEARKLTNENIIINEILNDISYICTDVKERHLLDKASTYHDVDIVLLEEKELNSMIEYKRLLSRGGTSKIHLVCYKPYNGMKCIQKTPFNGQVSLNELQILQYLNGAGGAPKLFAATQKYFLCSNAGDKTLADWVIDLIESKNPLKEESLLLFMSAVVENIKEIHDLDICHNDLKANNVMFDSNENSVSIIDFGFSCHSGSIVFDKEDLETFKHCTWMAPEIREGKPCSKASDIYSIGFMFGQIIFNSGMTQDLLKPVKALIGKALMEDPSKRPTANDFLSVLYYISNREELEELRNNAKDVFSNINSNDALFKWLLSMFQVEDKEDERKP